MRHRSDIDGLRTLAILPVLGFHAYPGLFKGGFVGVDVFFVISGFLISSIIFEGISAGTFSVLEFYVRRILRIFPALATMLVACYAFGWFSLLPDEFKLLGKHIAAGSAFVQNFALLGETGYFDVASGLKPLLHLWSLAVEEQFYILFPPLIWLAWRFKVSAVTVIFFVFALSFGANIYFFRTETLFDFYFPLTRFWELMVGCALAWYMFPAKVSAATDGRGAFVDSGAVKSLKGVISIDFTRVILIKNFLQSTGGLSFFGVVCILLSVFLFDATTHFPGPYALLPTLGTAMIIIGGSENWVNRRILSNKAVVFIGLISYPLYLWHWPLLTFARILCSEVPAWWIRLGCLGLSVVLSVATYFFIEKPIRFGSNRRLKASLLAAAMVVVGVVGYQDYAHNGIVDRTQNIDAREFAEQFSRRESADACVKQYGAMDYCFLSKNSPPNIMLVGDSFSAHLFSGITEQFKDKSVLSYNLGNCNFAFGQVFANSSEKCRKTADVFHQYLADDNLKVVILYSSWVTGGIWIKSEFVSTKFTDPIWQEVMAESDPLKRAETIFRRTISTLIKANKTVIFVIRTPSLPFDMKGCISGQRPILSYYPFNQIRSKNCTISTDDYRTQKETHMHFVDSVLRDFPQVIIFDPTDLFCQNGQCSAVKNGKLLYVDSISHISPYGSNYLAQGLAPYIRQALEKSN